VFLRRIPICRAAVPSNSSGTRSRAKLSLSSLNRSVRTTLTNPFEPAKPLRMQKEQTRMSASAKLPSWTLSSNR
jgi:hypothetical protein